MAVDCSVTFVIVGDTTPHDIRLSGLGLGLGFGLGLGLGRNMPLCYHIYTIYISNNMHT